MVNKFVWEDYLKETNTIAAPKHIFKLVIIYNSSPQIQFDAYCVRKD